ncbi:MAG: peptide deformylase [Candidatus Omnitrophica bacterium CG12_big_fil_rev_8_21_14_0_65_43_15]|uniref:Peptide deformylase n=1 Tax=Candidatus Taenaricola geysiri TaxID=1974752 RepID=A0A2J0LFI1_9BACT|nr:MAG: peptide deformylase [Candidatus Omnitrophica bacterium CG12_big_fil_rev_8_21_14_0_65_43_15]
MPTLKIRVYPDPILKKKTSFVAGITDDEKKLFEDMAKTMYVAGGVGLAANQVGVSKQIMVLDVGRGLLKLANPKILKASCKKSGEEGCLSFPEISVKIKRPEKVVIEAMNHEGAKVKIEADGLFARALQHEMDHLAGVVIIDKIGIRQKFLIAGKLRKLKKK